LVNFDRARKGRRLTGTAVYHIVGRLGAKTGLVVRPHGLRHLAIATALDRTNGDVRAVAKFSRHKDLRTLRRYDDNRQDLAGKVTRLVATE
jgi:integrase/recombinase XerC